MMRCLVALLMISTMLHWPNMVLHYSSFSLFLKNAMIFSSIAVFAFFGQKRLLSFSNYFFLLGSVSVFYCVINGLYFHSYMLRVLFFISLCAAFLRYPQLAITYCKIGIFVSFFLAIQTIGNILIIVTALPVSYHPVEFINDDKVREFNFLWGFKNDALYYRTQSYFTETNRLAYFLTPSLFISWYYGKRNLAYKYISILIGIAILSTFSIATGVAIATAATAYMVFSRKKRLSYIFVVPFILLLSSAIYGYNPDYFSFVLDKSGSILARIIGIISKFNMVMNNPFGYSESAMAQQIMLDGGGSTLTLLHWAVAGGVQSAGILVLVLILWLGAIRRLLFSENDLLALLGAGMLASIMQQSFYGTYFEYYFLSMMATVVVLARMDGYAENGVEVTPARQVRSDR